MASLTAQNWATLFAAGPRGQIVVWEDPGVILVCMIQGRDSFRWTGNILVDNRESTPLSAILVFFNYIAWPIDQLPLCLDSAVLEIHR